MISIDATAAGAVLNTQGATTSHTTEAYVGTKANLTLNDPLALHATSSNTAKAGEANIQAGFANVAYAKSEANARVVPRTPMSRRGRRSMPPA